MKYVSILVQNMLCVNFCRLSIVCAIYSNVDINCVIFNHLQVNIMSFISDDIRLFLKVDYLKPYGERGFPLSVQITSYSRIFL